MVGHMSKLNTLFLVSKQVIVIILCSIVVLVSLGFATFFALRANDELRKAKKAALDNGQVLYIVIEQYEVENFKFKPGGEVEILFEAAFTNELNHTQRYENEHGFNTVEIKNGVVKIIDADCRDRICMNSRITNGLSWFESPSIICFPHGIKIRWEAKDA